MSKQVREFLEKNKETYSKFKTIKDAYDYFLNHNKFGLSSETYSYDTFWNPFTKIIGKPPKAIKTEKVPKQTLKAVIQEPNKEFELKIYDPKKAKINEEIFVPLKTGKGIDKLISKQGGIMPGTTYVWVGGPGLGKSTICYDTYNSIQRNNKDVECMALSGEMKRIDIQAEEKEKPWMRNVKQVILTEYKPEEYIQVLESVILHGYHFLVIDSFQNIVERLRNFCGFTGAEAAHYLFGLIEKANNGDTKTGHLTAVFLIQQVTKNGDFVGKNNLEHDTTGMARLYNDNNRYIMFSKNRRHGELQGKRLYYFLDDNNEVVYDIERLESDIEQEKLLIKEKKAMAESKSTFEEMILAGKSHTSLEELINDPNQADWEME